MQVGTFESTEGEVVTKMPASAFADFNQMALIGAEEVVSILQLKIAQGVPIKDVNCVPRIYTFLNGAFIYSAGIGGQFKLAGVPPMMGHIFRETPNSVSMLCTVVVKDGETMALSEVWTSSGKVASALKAVEQLQTQ
jgi:hypothetical protein